MLLDFGSVLTGLPKGYKLTRKSWNNEDKYIYYVPPSKVSKNTFIAKKYFGDNEGVYSAHINMRTPENNIFPWTPSQSDMFAEDWYVID